MTGDREKLQDMIKYKRGHAIVTTNNSQLSIAHFGTTIFTPRYSPHKVSLQEIYYVPGMKKRITFSIITNIIR